MNDELMFQMAVQLTAAKLQAHFISPASSGVDGWLEQEIEDHWKMLRELWRLGHKSDNVHPIS